MAVEYRDGRSSGMCTKWDCAVRGVKCNACDGDDQYVPENKKDG